MRFQPSWVVEALQPETVESVFLPVCPNAEALLWFKRHGARLYVNDPRLTRFVPLQALVENDQETFSRENTEQVNRVMNRSPDINLNPFREWENRPFDRRRLDYLFFWREVAEEIASPVQKNLFFTAVRSVLGYWLSLHAAEVPPYFPPDEVLGHFLKRQSELIFRGRERAFAMNDLPGELSEEVDAGLYVVPLTFRDEPSTMGDSERFFQAWLKGSGDLPGAREDLHRRMAGWVFEWGKPPPFAGWPAKAGAAHQVAICWSSDGLPPRVHEDEVVRPLVKVFSPIFPQYRLHMKTADQMNDEVDFLLTFRK